MTGVIVLIVGVIAIMKWDRHLDGTMDRLERRATDPLIDGQ